MNGDVATYDLRSYSQPLACLAATKRQPCHSVLPIPAALGGGVVSASMNAVTDWQGADPTALRGVPLPTVGLAGPCCSVDWEPTGGALLCSLRPAPDGSAPARLQLLSPAETSTGREWVAEHTLTGHSGRAVLSRVAAVPSGRGGGDSLVAAADEGTGCVALWSLRAAASGAAAQVPFRLPPHESPVVDIRVDADAQNRCGVNKTTPLCRDFWFSPLMQSMRCCDCADAWAGGVSWRVATQGGWGGPLHGKPVGRVSVDLLEGPHRSSRALR